LGEASAYIQNDSILNILGEASAHIQSGSMF